MVVRWDVPAVSSTKVLGYRVYVNEPDSGAVPSRLVYDGEAVATLVEAKVSGLKSGKTYWFTY
jgi:hypothetical protein